MPGKIERKKPEKKKAGLAKEEGETTAERQRERKRFFWRGFLELRLLRRGVLMPRTRADWFCG